MKSNEASKAVISFLILIVFGIFALGSLFIVLIGANDYQSIFNRVEQNNQMRASLSYVANKVRQGDEAGAIQVVEQDNIQVLSITQEIEGQLYDTYIYYYKGEINEQFVKHNAKLNLNGGTPIVAANDFQVSKKENTLTLQVKCDQMKNPLKLQLHLQS